MAADSLIDKDDPFWEDMEDVLFVCVKSDKTVHLKTTVKDMEDLKSIASTLFMMALFQELKSLPKDVDKLH
jgi:hypothetical protein